MNIKSHTPALAAVRSDVVRGVWRVADPKITLASVASMLLGAAFAAAQGPIAWEWLLLTVLGVFFIEVAKNASGEIFDFDSGTDLAIRPEERSPFSGGKRILVDGLMTRREAALLAAFAYVLGAGAGLWIVFAREPRVLILGMIGVALAYFYHAPPFRLSYRGLGEPAVALCYGPLIACGTYLVQRGRVSAELVLASIPLGLMIAAFLVINELPDMRADALAQKRTWVVRLGRRRGSLAYVALVAGALSIMLLLPALGMEPGVLLGVISLPFAALAIDRLLDAPPTAAELVPVQRLTLLSFLLLSAGMSLGILLW